MFLSNLLLKKQSIKNFYFVKKVPQFQSIYYKTLCLTAARWKMI